MDGGFVAFSIEGIERLNGASLRIPEFRALPADPECAGGEGRLLCRGSDKVEIPTIPGFEEGEAARGAGDLADGVVS